MRLLGVSAGPSECAFSPPTGAPPPTRWLLPLDACSACLEVGDAAAQLAGGRAHHRRGAPGMGVAEVLTSLIARLADAREPGALKLLTVANGGPGGLPARLLGCHRPGKLLDPADANGVEQLIGELSDELGDRLRASQAGGLAWPARDPARRRGGRHAGALRERPFDDLYTRRAGADTDARGHRSGPPRCPTD